MQMCTVVACDIRSSMMHSGRVGIFLFLTLGNNRRREEGKGEWQEKDENAPKILPIIYKKA